jgi:DNA-binding HxlR family transcriptional regulator
MLGIFNAGRWYNKLRKNACSKNYIYCSMSIITLSLPHLILKRLRSYLKVQPRMTQKQGPVLDLIDILGRKWVLRILWELDTQAGTFRDIQTRCGDLSPTIINKRLKELQEAALIIKSQHRGYELSELGKELVAFFYPVNDFAEKWQKIIKQ